MKNKGFDRSIVSLNIYDNYDSESLYTVAIPTYKRSRLLKESLDSIFSQEKISFSFNIVVVDNNPERDDETERLMSKYKEEPNLSYYKNEENLGMVGNWNRLFLLSRTKYVIMLHDDDLLHPLFMYYIDEQIQNENCDVLKPKEYRWRDEGSPIDFPKILTKTRSSRIYDIENFNGFPIGAPTGCLFNRQRFLDFGGFNEVFSPAAGDFDFIVRFSARHKVCQLNHYLIGYRLAQNAACNSEVQYSGTDRCYRIIFDMLKTYHLPTLIINESWKYYLKGWCKNIKKEWNIDFIYEKALSRIGLSNSRFHLDIVCYIIIKLFVSFYLVLHGKFKVVDLNHWKNKIFKGE